MVALGNISRVATYVEPVLNDKIQDLAKQDGVSVSTWLRRLIIKELLKGGQISQEMLTEMAIR